MRHSIRRAQNVLPVLIKQCDTLLNTIHNRNVDAAVFSIPIGMVSCWTFDSIIPLIPTFYLSYKYMSGPNYTEEQELSYLENKIHEIDNPKDKLEYQAKIYEVRKYFH